MSAQKRLLSHPRRSVKPDASLAILNIVLLLIMAFLATGALTNASGDRQVDVAETLDLPIDQLPRPALVVLPGGGLLLDGQPILSEAIAPALAGQTVLHVLIDRTAPAAQLLDLIARPELSGLDILLVTLHRKAAP